MKDFKVVKDSCFGQTLESQYKLVFAQLKNSLLPTSDLAQVLGENISVSWKFHILLFHVQPFIEYHNCGLSKFAEQCGEPIHFKFKPTWRRFKRLEEQTQHGEQMLPSVVNFNGKEVLFSITFDMLP